MKLKEAIEVSGTPSSMAEKLAEAKRILGTKWVLHPDYVPTENHKYYGSLVMEKIRNDAIKRGVHV